MIVSDSTTLIVLLELQKMEFLSNIFEKIYVPQGVFDEINYKKNISLPGFLEIKNIKNIQKQKELEQLLDKGESEAIVLALEEKLPLIIDEKKGRKIAKNLDVKIIGLMGIVLLNYKRGYISKNEAKEFFDKALERGFRISRELLEKFMQSL